MSRTAPMAAANIRVFDDAIGVDHLKLLFLPVAKELRRVSHNPVLLKQKEKESVCACMRVCSHAHSLTNTHKHSLTHSHSYTLPPSYNVGKRGLVVVWVVERRVVLWLQLRRALVRRR